MTATMKPPRLGPPLISLAYYALTVTSSSATLYLIGLITSKALAITCVSTWAVLSMLYILAPSLRNRAPAATCRKHRRRGPQVGYAAGKAPSVAERRKNLEAVHDLLEAVTAAEGSLRKERWPSVRSLAPASRVQTTHVGLEEAVRAVCQRQLWSDADVEAWESAVVLRGKVVSGHTNVNLAEMVNATDSLTTATDKLLASSFDPPTAAHVSSCNQLRWESSAGHRHLEVVRS